MKNLLLASASLLAGVITASSVLAADMPVKAVAYKAPVEVFNWTGFYVGVHGGGGWGTSDATTVPQVIPGLGPVTVPTTTTKGSGALAGGQIGYNYQTGMWVLGLEAQASWANLTGSTNACSISAGGFLLSTACLGSGKSDALGTVSGRVGVAFDRVMLYGKAGGAWTSNQYQTVLTAPLVGFNGTSFNASDTRRGWMVGVGAEYAFTNNWSVKIEYNYMDLGTERLRFTSATTPLTSDVDVRQQLNVVKAGINYRFGGPIVARY